MAVIWEQLQALFILVLWYPLINLAAFAAGAALLLGLAELMMYVTYRLLTRMGLIA
jgi:hypothetical protein